MYLILTNQNITMKSTFKSLFVLLLCIFLNSCSENDSKVTNPNQSADNTEFINDFEKAYNETESQSTDDRKFINDFEQAYSGNENQSANDKKFINDFEQAYNGTENQSTDDRKFIDEFKKGYNRTENQLKKMN